MKMAKRPTTPPEEITKTKEPNKEPPYIIETVVITKEVYNPKYGDDRTCKCGHAYYRHFDTYENMWNAGCKYCGCNTFEE